MMSVLIVLSWPIPPVVGRKKERERKREREGGRERGGEGGRER